MKKIIVLLILVMAASQLFAQMPGGFQRGAQGGQQISGRFYGKVVDASNKGVDAASVTLVQTRMDTATKKPKEIVLGGMLTSKLGDFSIENVPVFGKYKLRITGIGYTTYEQAVQFDMPNRSAGAPNDPSSMIGAIDKDLGNIKLAISENVLNNITVTASKPQLQLGIDRKIFNVAGNITSVGGTAVDVMKNVPSINVDIDGNVTLRNNAPQIFVDGRPTNLTLDQIPADAIESVEIITNPSAKFDASGGTAGILNIVMKKNKRVGYSGNIRASVDSRGKIGLGTDINIRQQKINIFGSANFNQRKSISNGTTTRTTLFSPATNSTQYDKTISNINFGFVRGGFDYFIDNRNTITLNGTYVRGGPRSTSNSDIYIDSLTTPVHSAYSQKMSNNKSNFRNLGYQLSYKHTFPKNGHELTADATYNNGHNDNFTTIGTNYFSMPGKVYNSSFNQQQQVNGNSKNLVVQTDYTNPINDHSKFEAGARISIRSNESANEFDTVNANGSLSPIVSQNIIYNSTDNIYAGYLNFSNRINNFGYQLGLRAESSDYQGNLTNKGQAFDIKYPISLFPSIFLSDKISDNDELQMNYSRRINRPNFFQLFPFTDLTDSLNITRGNPNLKPEFTNSIEFSYSKTFKNRDNFIASLYYKNTNNLITRYPVIDTTIYRGKQVIVNSYLNANSSYITGLELTSRNKITKWWDMTSNLNLFTAKISYDNLPSPDQFFSYFFKLNNTFKLPKNFSIQLSGDYQSKIISSPNSGGGGRFGGGGGGFGGPSNATGQGFIRPNYSVDGAIRYEFLKNKVASLSLNINDIFRTRKFDSYTQTSFYIQNSVRYRDPQVFRLNFNYRFGKFDATLFKRKNTKAENNINQDVNF